MVLIKKDYQTLKMLKRDAKGDFIVVIENSVARGTIIKSSLVLSRKEFDDMLDAADKLLEGKETVSEVEEDGTVS